MYFDTFNALVCLISTGCRSEG